MYYTYAMQERWKVLRQKTLGLPGEIVWSYGERKIKLGIEGWENIELAKKHLEKGSLLVYFNHTSFLDAGLVLEVIFKNLEPSEQKPLVLASYKHLDWRRGPVNAFHAIVIKSAALAKGFELAPVVQEYDREAYKNFVRINTPSIRRSIRKLHSRGGIVLVAPEETRSKKGTLARAKEGVEFFFTSKTSQKETFAWPIGIAGVEKVHGKGNVRLNLSMPIKLVIGKPIAYQEAEEEAKLLDLPIKDVLMIRLAKLLPEEYWGAYAEEMEAFLQSSL